MAHSIETHYDNLKVVRTAPIDVIKASYRLLAQKYHPDRNPAPGALRNMQLINKAWDVLSDPERRASHDQWIANQERRMAPRAPAAAPGHPHPVADQEAETWFGPYAKRLAAMVGGALAVILIAAYVMYFFDGKAQEAVVLELQQSAAAETKPVPGQRLPHGYYMASNAWERASGPATFEIDNTAGSKDAEVQLSRDGKPVHTIYVHAGRRLEVDSLALGVYTVKYKVLVQGQAHAYQAKQAFALIQTPEEAREQRYNKFNRTRVSSFHIAGDAANADRIAPAAF